MNILPRARMLLLALLWPAAALVVIQQFPGLLEAWTGTGELLLLGLALAGGATAGFFAQWRITAGALLLLLAWAGVRFADMPLAMSHLPVLGLCLLPWLREKGLTGPPLLVTGALVLVTVSLWLRGDPPAALVDEWLATPVALGDEAFSVTLLLAATGALLILLRMLVRQDATDLALAGAAGALLVVVHEPATTVTGLAASLGGAMALWTGLLMHAWRLAYRDELTGLPNRRALEDRLRARPRRWSLAMVDVDHFKKFNDRWGHDIGDQVLRRVAAGLRGVRGRGRAFRYGGEEFAVFFPHDDLERAAEAVEAARARIGAQPFHIRGPRTGTKQRGKQKARAEQRITASAGLAGARNGEPVEATFRRADQALYKAKHQGRNRLVTDEARKQAKRSGK